MEKFEGINIFYDSSECESDIFAPINEMSVQEFIESANHIVVEEWGAADMYDGFPFTEKDVEKGYVFFDPEFQYENEKGFYMIGDSDSPGAIECYRISLH